jgi:DNA-binding NtrC family response regulator
VVANPSRALVRVVLAPAPREVVETLRVVLEREGIDVRIASTREEAVATLTAEESEAAITHAPRTLEQIERLAIEHALTLTGGSVSEAATVLGLSRSALYRRLQYHGIPRNGGTRARLTTPLT